MFDKEFYPTPIELIEKMINPLLKSINRVGRVFDPDRFGGSPQILEPSAGKGDILDSITGLRWDEC
jgi:hypothetical protein